MEIGLCWYCGTSWVRESAWGEQKKAETGDWFCLLQQRRSYLSDRMLFPLGFEDWIGRSIGVWQKDWIGVLRVMAHKSAEN